MSSNRIRPRQPERVNNERVAVAKITTTVTRALARDPRDKYPDATQYYVNSAMLLQDAEQLRLRFFSSGVYILLIHLIELALKNYLLRNGVSKKI